MGVGVVYPAVSALGDLGVATPPLVVAVRTGELLAAGMTEAEVLADFPYLTHDDILACLGYAAASEHRMLVATSEASFDQNTSPSLAGNSTTCFWDQTMGITSKCMNGLTPRCGNSRAITISSYSPKT